MLDGQPVSNAHAKAAYTLDAPDTRSQLRTEQTSIGGLVGEATHGCQTEVDDCRRVGALFQMDAVAQNDGPIKCEPRLRAVPPHKLVDRVVVRALATCGRQAV